MYFFARKNLKIYFQNALQKTLTNASILETASSAVANGFPKAASSHMNEFRKPLGLTIHYYVKKIPAAFKNMFLWLLVAFGNLFVTVLASL